MIRRKYPHTRLRRTRVKGFIRDLIAQNKLTTDDLIQPIFIADQSEDKIEIPSMPGIHRHNLDSFYFEVESLINEGIKSVAIFPAIDASKKDEDGSHALDEGNIVCLALAGLSERFPEIIKIADVALDPYTDHGHDGLLIDGRVDNDKTVKLLQDQALLLAHSGADIIAPSDMMDGRIGVIRKKLDENNFEDKIILSYAAKYNSKFYGPFRDAVNSKNNLGTSDKSSYQMNPANSLEALNEVAMDIEEGADIVMVKPGMPYLDIISKIKEEFKVPTFAYQVSGEYAMIMESVNKGWLDKGVIIESLTSFKRAGADAVLTYFAKDLIKEFNL